MFQSDLAALPIQYPIFSSLYISISIYMYIFNLNRNKYFLTFLTFSCLGLYVPANGT